MLKKTDTAAAVREALAAHLAASGAADAPELARVTLLHLVDWARMTNALPQAAVAALMTLPETSSE